MEHATCYDPLVSWLERHIWLIASNLHECKSREWQQSTCYDLDRFVDIPENNDGSIHLQIQNFVNWNFIKKNKDTSLWKLYPHSTCLASFFTWCAWNHNTECQTFHTKTADATQLSVLTGQLWHFNSFDVAVVWITSAQPEQKLSVSIHASIYKELSYDVKDVDWGVFNTHLHQQMSSLVL